MAGYHRAGLSIKNLKKGIIKMNEITNQFQPLSDEEKIIAAFSGEHSLSYCSWVPETEEDQIKLFNATNNPEYRVSDFINKEIEVRHVYCEPVKFTDEETGDITFAPRIVLIDPEGNGYQAVSIGVFNSINRLINSTKNEKVHGPEDWEKPIKISIRQTMKGSKQILSIMRV